ncbi:MAG: hypothetical protein ACR2GY_13880 [Phycisphaerales bacterium]
MRPPARSVRPQDEVKHTPLAIVIGTLAAAGSIALVWLLGHIGFRLGFAQAVGVPELLAESGGGLSTGALIIMHVPMHMFAATVAEPMLLMLAFLLIAVPAGGLVGAKRAVPGGPRPSPLFVGFSWAGAIAGALFGAVAIAYVVSPFRQAWVQPMSLNAVEFEAWLNNMTIAAGLDGMMLIAAALWVVLVMRVECPPWMRGIAASAALFGLVVVTMAAGISNATVAHISMDRSVIDAGEAAVTEGAAATAPLQASTQQRILIGYTRRHAVTLSVSDDGEGRVMIAMSDIPTRMRVVDRVSISRLITDAAPEQPEF